MTKRCICNTTDYQKHHSSYTSLSYSTLSIAKIMSSHTYHLQTQCVLVRNFQHDFIPSVAHLTLKLTTTQHPRTILRKSHEPVSDSLAKKSHYKQEIFEFIHCQGTRNSVQNVPCNTHIHVYKTKQNN